MAKKAERKKELMLMESNSKGSKERKSPINQKVTPNNIYNINKEVEELGNKTERKSSLNTLRHNVSALMGQTRNSLLGAIAGKEIQNRSLIMNYGS